jgi:hypothetical protein
MTLNRYIMHKYLYALVFVFLVPKISLAQPPANAADYPFSSASGNYTELSGATAVTAVQVDDGRSASLPIGFSFPFCGANYTTVIAGSNGWLTFKTAMTKNVQDNQGIHSPPPAVTLGELADIAPGIMPLWDDLGGDHASSRGFYTTIGTAPNRVFIFEWRNFKWDYSATTPVISLQARLYENGTIEYIYRPESGAIAFGTENNPSDPGYKPGWTGASIGIAKSATDFQFLTSSSASPTPSSTSPYTTNIQTKPANGQIYRWGPAECDINNVDILVTTACPGKNASLSAYSFIPASVTFKWQFSDNNVTWQDYTGPGATSNTITPVYTQETWYRVILTCTKSGTSVTSAPKLLKAKEFYYCYCNSAATAVAGMDIGKVRIITNPGDDTLLNNGFADPIIPFNNSNSNKTYTDFRPTAPIPTLYLDSSYNFVVNQVNSAAFAEGVVTIFLDLDASGTFDSVERVIVENTSLPLLPGNIQATYTIPNTTTVGITGMRVIIKAGTTRADSCGTYTDGETEDYLVRISYPPCNGDVNAGRIDASDTSMCNYYGYTLFDTTYEKRVSGVTKIWQESGDQVNWLNIAGSENKDSLMRIFIGQPMYYRVRMVCIQSMDTTYTEVVRVNNKPGYKCYCFSRAEGGLSDSSDIGSFTIGTYETNPTGSHVLNPQSYRDRTDFTDANPIELKVDSTYKIAVFQTMLGKNHSDGKVTLFIDYNNNHKYDIPEERVFTGFTSVARFVLTDNVYIPNTAITDVATGMRLILNSDLAPNAPSDSACGTYVSGETEDFIVILKRPFKQSVDGVQSLKNIDVYPNPTNGDFNVMFTGGVTGTAKVSVMNVTGQQIFAQSYQYNGQLFKEAIHLGEIAKGVYFVNVEANGEKIVRKLVIQ